MNPPLFKDAGQAGLYHLHPTCHDILPSLASAAHRQLRSVELHRTQGLQSLLRELGKQLDFPDWYGANLDALHDCLCDPAWRGEQGTILLLTGISNLRRSAPDALAPLIEVLRSACLPQPGLGAPLWILLSEPVRGVDRLPAA